jgi:hypothetical protein
MAEPAGAIPVSPPAPKLTVVPGSRGAPVVREMRREDLPEAAAMFAEVMRITPPGTEPELVAFFERALFDHPWADPEIPSYVAEAADGAIVGMVGVQTRRMRMGDRDLRLACPGFFVVATRARGAALGTELARRVMSGPQDASFGDSASVVIERLFAPRFGGRGVELPGVHWVRPWRPSAVFDGLMPAASARVQAVGAGRLLGRGVDRVAERATRSFLEPPRVETLAERLTPELILEHRASLLEGPGPHVAYDEAWLGWLFGELGRSEARGEPVAHLIRDAGGRLLGWYVYFLRPGGRSEVMQIVARARDKGAVLDHLLRHAWEGGSAMLRGRLEPGLTGLVCRRKCMLWYRGGVLAHSSDPGLAEALVRHGTLSRLDNEWFSDSLV